MVDKKTTTTKPAAAPVAPAAAAPVHGPAQGLAVAALVVGIVAFVFGWAPFFGFVAGVAAVVLGIIALKKGGSKGMSVAGIITGGLAILWNIVVSAILIVGLIAASTVGVAYGGAVNQALGQYNAENKALVDAKKDFNKGDTAVFGHFQVKVDNVKRDYTTDSVYTQPASGNEFIVVTVTVKNVAATSETISNYDLKMNDNGVIDTASYLSVDPAFNGAELAPNASLSGTIVYEVTKGSTNLKLQYETYAYDLNAGLKNLTFTLAL